MQIRQLLFYFFLIFFMSGSFTPMQAGYVPPPVEPSAKSAELKPAKQKRFLFWKKKSPKKAKKQQDIFGFLALIVSFVGIVLAITGFALILLNSAWAGVFFFPGMVISLVGLLLALLSASDGQKKTALIFSLIGLALGGIVIALNLLL